MSTSECRDITTLHPKLQELANKLVSECKKQGINLKIGECYRTVARQDYLYAQGRTRPGNIVTNAKGSDMSSYHQWRLAFDVFINEKGNEYNTTLLKKAGAIGEKLGLEWGGRWTNPVDMPHFQYTYGLSIKQLKAGAKIPDYPEKVTEKVTHNVTVTTSKVSVMGEQLEVGAVLINGNNYIKIRSLESKGLAIGYEAGMPTVNFKKNGTSVATSTVANLGKSYTVELSATKVNVCGEVLEVDTVNIEGNNFIKLRGLEGKNITIGYANGVATVNKK